MRRRMYNRAMTLKMQRMKKVRLHAYEVNSALVMIQHPVYTYNEDFLVDSSSQVIGRRHGYKAMFA